MFAQVGFIVHLIAFLDPLIGRPQAATAVALLTAMAMAGRVLFSTVIDRLNQRLASAISFVSQAVALAIIINSRNEMLLIGCCALFGFSVGNLITLPSLIVQREFAPASFGVLISLITAINQVTYAFGPGVIGLLRDLSGSYSLPFYGCICLELTAAVLIMVRAKLEGDSPRGAAARSSRSSRLREHRKLAVSRARPLLLRTIPIELDAVLVGIAQVQRFADAVIAGAVELDPGADHPVQRVRQRRPGRIEDRGVKQSRGARRRRMAAFALPGVEPDMVVIAAGRNEGRARAHPLHQLEAEHAAVKRKRAVEIGDLEMNMPDPRAGNDGWIFGHAVSPLRLHLAPLAGRGRHARSAAG